MIFILKRSEPHCLTELRTQPGARYADLRPPCKDEVREALAREQGFLCCYCMQRVRVTVGDRHAANELEIEHRVPQSAQEGTGLQLAWKNLLGTCPGNSHTSAPDQHCGHRKGEQLMSLDPTEAKLELRLRYDALGRVLAETSELQSELDDILNLNATHLRRNRVKALQGFQEALRRKRPRGIWAREWLERQLEPSTRGELPEFVGILRWSVRKRRTRPQ